MKFSLPQEVENHPRKIREIVVEEVCTLEDDVNQCNH